MIQPLRKTHRRIFLALALLLPALFLSGIALRHTWPVSPKSKNPAVSSVPTGVTR
jgi:hypothetical protein